MIKDEGNRQHIRLREEIPVSWRVEPTGPTGEGTIRNLSISGAFMDSQSMAKLPKNTELSLTALDTNKYPFFSCRAKFVWGRPTLSAKRHYLCGLEFINLSEESLKQLQVFVDKIANLSDVAIVEKYLGMNE